MYTNQGFTVEKLGFAFCSRTYSPKRHKGHKDRFIKEPPSKKTPNLCVFVVKFFLHSRSALIGSVRVARSAGNRQASSPARANTNGFRTTASMRLNTAVFVPIPNPRIKTAVIVNPGDLS